jgi:hypothetical protein
MALLSGVCIGWLLGYSSAHDPRFQKLIATSKGIPTGKEYISYITRTHARYLANRAHTDLDILMRLESGVISESEAILTQSLGGFYHQWTVRQEKRPVPPEIQEALLRIKQAAVKYESVQAVLRYKPKDKQNAV